MVEKVASISLVNKLRAIMLIDANSNYHNHMIFGSQDEPRKTAQNGSVESVRKKKMPSSNRY